MCTRYLHEHYHVTKTELQLPHDYQCVTAKPSLLARYAQLVEHSHEHYEERSWQCKSNQSQFKNRAEQNRIYMHLEIHADYALSVLACFEYIFCNFHIVLT